MCWFQFTHPVWGATLGVPRIAVAPRVSIHAPRVGCDYVRGAEPQRQCRFQFTHPVWGATCLHMGTQAQAGFQFTHPVWGATPIGGLSTLNTSFQFTHPVWGATVMLSTKQ